MQEKIKENILLHFVKIIISKYFLIKYKNSW
jgi:hypothetical protein